MPNERSWTKTEYILYDSAYIHFRKNKLTYIVIEIRPVVAKGQDGEVEKGHVDTFWGERYVHNLNCDDGFASIHIHQNRSDHTLQMCAANCQLYLNS